MSSSPTTPGSVSSDSARHEKCTPVSKRRSSRKRRSLAVIQQSTVDEMSKEEEGEDMPPLLGSPSPQQQQKQQRRDTADSADLRDLMTALNSSSRRDTEESFNTARGSLAASIDTPQSGKPKPRRKSKSKKGRRLTADGADLESLMKGLEDGENEEEEGSDDDDDEGEELACAAETPTPPPLNVSAASSDSSSVSTRVPTPHSKSSQMSDGGDDVVEDEEQDTLPPLAASPFKNFSKRKGKRSASLGGGDGEGEGAPKGILNKGRMSLPGGNIKVDEEVRDAEDKTKMRNNKKKKRRKSVAFGSPQAAEFNSSSPSANLTPMPTSEAKQKYTVPDTSIMSESSADTTNSSTANGDSEDNTVELEGDLNALMTSVGQGYGTDMVDDDNTVELEGDISDLLKNAEDEQEGGEDETMEIEGDLSAVLDSVGGELDKIGKENGGKIAEVVINSPKSTRVDFSPTPKYEDDFAGIMRKAEGRVEENLSNVKIDVCCKEIVNFCSRNDKVSFDQAVHDVDSVFLKCCQAAVDVKGKGQNIAVLDIVGEVVEAAKEEIKVKMEQTKEGGRALLETAKADNPEIVKVIQIGMRRKGETEFKDKLRELYGKVKTRVLNDWRSWEKRCAVAMIAAFEERKDEEKENLEVLEGHLQKVQSAIKEAERGMSEKLREAKRAIVEKRKKELEEARAENERLSNEVEELERKAGEVAEILAREERKAEEFKEVKEVKAKVVASQKDSNDRSKKFKTLEGLLLYSPVQVNSSNIICDFTGGMMTETRVSLGFDIKSEGVTANMLLKKAEKGRKGRMLTNSLSSEATKLVAKRIQGMIGYVNGTLEVNSAAEIPSILQEMEVSIGRVEALAREVSEVSISNEIAVEESSDSWLVTVVFVGRKTKTKVNAVFEIPFKGYPFSHISCVCECVIGDLEEEKMAEAVRRNANVGWGYFYRCTQVVKSFIK